jgi:peptidoglycan/LPS O-acetylase OafA/YrhL
MLAEPRLGAPLVGVTQTLMSTTFPRPPRPAAAATPVPAADPPLTMMRSAPVTGRLHHRNNFDLLRLCFATLVYLGHYNWIFPISPLTTRVLAWFIGDDGQRCVQGFFVISGFLMFQSYTRSNDLLVYFEKRFRRIYPAYFVVIISSVLLGSLLTNLTIYEYFSNNVIKYLIANLSFLNFIHPFLPGVFEDQPIHYVNAPLWTLKVEVAFYMTLPLIFMITKVCRFWILCGIIYVISIVYYYVCGLMAQATGLHLYHVLATQLPGQLCFFIAGAFVASCHDYIKEHSKRFFVISVLSLLGLALSGAYILYPICLTIIVLSFSLLLPQIIEWKNYPDLSYGIYVIHFPLLQTIYSIRLFHGSQTLRFMIASVATFYLSYLMWRFVEAPALRGRWAKRPAPPIEAVS